MAENALVRKTDR